MKEYLYLAIDRDGSKVTGEAEANDPKKIVAALQAKGLTVLEVVPVKEKHWIYYLLQPVKGQVLAMFIRQLGVMLTAGIPLATGLRSLIPESGPLHFRKATERLSRDVEHGFSLSQAMRRAPEFFNDYMVGSVRIGEHSGNLDVALHQCADYYEREYTYSRKLKAALVYPVVLFTAAGGLVFFIFTFMIPRFVGLFVDLQVELPWATKMLVNAAYLMETYGMVALITLLGPVSALLYLTYHYSRTGSGRMFFDRVALKVPWYGRQVRFRMLSQYFRALGSLMTSGVTIETSLRLLERSLDREILRRTVTYQLRDVRQGKPFVGAINVYKIFPPMALEMLSVGEETGEIEAMMDRMTNYYDEEMVRGLETIGKLVEPVILCGMGAIVAFLLLAAFQPIYQLAASF